MVAIVFLALQTQDLASRLTALSSSSSISAETSTFSTSSVMPVECGVGTKTLTETAASYSISVKYPEFSGCASAKVLSDLNFYISDAVTYATREVKFTDNVSDIANSLTLDYEVTYNTSKAIGVLISGSNYLGGAHGSSIFLTINYDLVHNQALKLEDLQDGNKLTNKLSDYSITDLKKQLNDPGMNSQIEAGASPKSENFQFVVFAKTGLEVIFTDYQVGPYAIGPQKVTVPWNEVKPVVKTEIVNLLGL